MFAKKQEITILYYGEGSSRAEKKFNLSGTGFIGAG
jgi:hypothetical protein